MFEKTFHAKSALIGRKQKRTESEKDRPCFINLFDHNNPHLSGSVPQEMHDFLSHKILFKNLKIEYLVEGNDILINNLKEITIRETVPGHIEVEGTQEN